MQIDADEIPRIREALTEAAEGRPNFAGRYRLAAWGCGSGCTAGAILDKETGRVTELPFAAHRVMGTTYNPLLFRADSRLLIVSGSLNEEREGTFYFLWDGMQLEEIR